MTLGRDTRQSTQAWEPKHGRTDMDSFDASPRSFCTGFRVMLAMIGLLWQMRAVQGEDHVIEKPNIEAQCGSNHTIRP